MLGLPAAEPSRPARHGIVVAVSPPGADTGRNILEKGGNAVDAAVATAFAMAVTYPAAGNIGGGGFMLIYPAGKGEPVLIDYREKAPLAASKTMYTKHDSWYSHKAVGVPGTVRGLALAHARFGKLPWKDVVMPAVKLAEEGFVIDGPLAGSLNWIVGSSPEFPELRRVLGKDGAGRLGSRRSAGAEGPGQDAAPHRRAGAGWLLQGRRRRPARRRDEARRRTHYHGRPRRLRSQGRKPIHGTYRGHDVYGPPPPSSGGTCLVEMLNILENFDLRKHGRFSPETLHVMIETMRRAYCDRARYLGDQDFVKIPAFLTSKDYARKLAQSIDLAQGDAAARTWPATFRSRARATARRTSASSTATAWPWPTPTRWSAVTARASWSRGRAFCSTTR